MKTRHWFRIHSFTGVITGLLLFVICWSGSFAVISHEIDWLVTPEARVDVGESRVSWGTILQAARAGHPDGSISWMQAPLYPGSAAQVILDTPKHSALRVYINPYTGDIQGTQSSFNVQRFFRSFHMNLFIPNTGGVAIGLYLVSLFSLTMLISLVAALCFYKRWWRRFFRFKGGTGRVLLSELHKVTGLWSLWFSLIISVTGAWYLYETLQAEPFNYVGGVVEAPAPSSDPDLPSLPLDEVLGRAGAVWPELEIGTIAYGWSSPGSDTVYLEGQAGFPLVRDRANQMHLDPRTGEILWKNSAGDLPLYWLWSNMADPLHFGHFAGLWSKVVWFVFGLVLCGLILTGTWLHAHRLAREAGGRARHRWPGTGAAIAVSLLVLAVSVPFGFHQAREYYGPTLEGVSQLPILAPGVKAVIIGWVTLTLVIIALWVWMLWRPRDVSTDPAAKRAKP
ncbi:MAG: PepSY-associated TM helix domain-containing protein [Oleiphilaceae bacterium]|nr:PepSY-associated TM helix domain-containing protein [Oleiphilaceae bacterium]